MLPLLAHRVAPDVTEFQAMAGTIGTIAFLVALITSFFVEASPGTVNTTIVIVGLLIATFGAIINLPTLLFAGIALFPGSLLGLLFVLIPLKVISGNLNRGHRNRPRW